MSEQKHTYESVHQEFLEKNTHEHSHTHHILQKNLIGFFMPATGSCGDRKQTSGCLTGTPLWQWQELPFG